jgi:ribosomal protein L16/L10AE
MSSTTRKKLFRSLLLNQRIRTADISRAVFTRRVPQVKIHDFYICSFSGILLSSSQLESCRKVVTRIIRRQKPKASFLALAKFTLPYTSKSKNSRMGKGKGGIDSLMSRIDVFGPLFLLRGVSFICAVKICKQVQKKLQARTCVLSVRSNSFQYTPLFVSKAFSNVNFMVMNNKLVRSV